MNATHPTRCWAEIDCSALRHNARVARELAGPETGILAVVKADGYGHGMTPAAREIAAGGRVTSFGVANVVEAQHLREEMPAVSITILSPALPAEREEIVRARWLPWISTIDEARDYARLARLVYGPGAPPFEIEIKVDTGMGRMGVLPSRLDALVGAVKSLPELRLGGLITHLPSPDEDEAFTRDQLARFDELAVADAPLRQAQNSAGLIGYALGRRNSVRPGLMLYGSSPLPDFQTQLRPALALKTRVSLVRDLPGGHGISYGRTFVTPGPMRVGTLGAGYADGYKRRLSHSGAEVLVRGRRCALLGRVTMDQILVDLSAAPDAAPGDEAVLLGRQGPEEITVAELATRAGTIPWEIFTSISARVGRYYLDASPVAD